MIQKHTLVSYTNALLQTERFDDYCPNGLQIDGNDQIKKIISGVTASQALIEMAVEKGADTLLVHHGYFWKNETPCLTGIKGKRIKALLQHNINLIAYHLPLDAHETLGNNVQLAARIRGETRAHACQHLDFSKFNLKITTKPASASPKSLVWYGEFAEACAAELLAQHLTHVLERAPLLIPGAGSKPIKTLAWCTGGAQDFIEEAILAKADAYLTGEVSERTTHLARENGIHFLAAGHHATERYGIQALGEHLADHFGIEHEFIDIDNPV